VTYGIKVKDTEYYNDRFREVLAEVYGLARGTKTNDYGETWARLGLRGLYLKMFIKEGRLHELIWLSKEAKVKDEKLRDTMLDMAAYAIYGVIALDEGNIEGDEQRMEYVNNMIRSLISTINHKYCLEEAHLRGRE